MSGVGKVRTVRRRRGGGRRSGLRSGTGVKGGGWGKEGRSGDKESVQESDCLTEATRPRRKIRPVSSCCSRGIDPQSLQYVTLSLSLPALKSLYDRTRRTTLRLNRLRVKGRQAEDAVLGSIQEKLQELSSRTRPTRLERCPWNEDAYIISPPNVQVKHLIDLSPHKQGLFHFQSWSSIIPPLCIEYGRGQNLLDMCAAPGGKASMIAEKMEGDSRLVVNEKDRKRYEKMSFVLSQLVPEDMMCRLSLRNCDARKFRLVETGTEASTEDLQSGELSKLGDSEG
eukprot:758617-Hanusia_phi.AAC.7